MNESDVVQQDYPVLVVAYDDKTRALIAASPKQFGISTVACSTFGEAQEYALSGRCRGLLVELTTMIKAKDTE